MRIIEVREVTRPIASPIRNAYIDFSKMTISLVAVLTDVVRNGQAVVGYGFNSNGRYGQGGLIRERFAPRLVEAEPASLLDDPLFGRDDPLRCVQLGPCQRIHRRSVPAAQHGRFLDPVGACVTDRLADP